MLWQIQGGFGPTLFFTGSCLGYLKRPLKMASPTFQVSKFFPGSMPLIPLDSTKFEPPATKSWIKPSIWEVIHGWHLTNFTPIFLLISFKCLQKFWWFLMRKSLPLNSLQQLKFAVLGLGDSSYTKWVVASFWRYYHLVLVWRQIVSMVSIITSHNEIVIGEDIFI